MVEPVVLLFGLAVLLDGTVPDGLRKAMLGRARVSQHAQTLANPAFYVRTNG